MAVLAADIGGTTTTVALVTGKKLAHIEQAPTASIRDLGVFLKAYLEKHKVVVRFISIAAAGPVLGNTVALTNTKLTIDAKKLSTALKKRTILLNDFVAAGMAVPLLTKKDLLLIQPGSAEPRNVTLLGVGTGLGKALVLTREKIVVASEGGHCDLPLLHDELELGRFLTDKDGVLEYESVLSGRGIEHVYEYYAMLHKSAVDVMAADDDASRATKEFFVKVLARAAKNYVLETRADAIYLTGGVVRKNAQFIKERFLDELHCVRSTHDGFVKGIRIAIILHKNIGLLGAGNAVTR